MPQAVETEVVEIHETMPPQTTEKRAPSDKASMERPESESRTPSRKLSRSVLVLVIAIAVAGATLWWFYSQNSESTDDAQIEGHLDLVSARISGTVSYINPRVQNNQFVGEGTLMLELDP